MSSHKLNLLSSDSAEQPAHQVARPPKARPPKAAPKARPPKAKPPKAAPKARPPKLASPARHPIILHGYNPDEAFFAECLSTDGVEAFFRQCPATELTDVEVKLLNSLISVSEAVQAALSKGVSLQEWAEKRIPNGFEEQVNRSSLVYVGPSRADTPRMPSAQTAKHSAAPCVAAPPVKKVVRLKLQAQATTAMQHSSGNAERPADDFAESSAELPAVIYDEEAFASFIASLCGGDLLFQYLPAIELTGLEVNLFNSLISVSESLQAALPRSVSLQEWAARRIPKDCPGLPHIYPSQPKSARSAVQPDSDSTAALLEYAIPKTLLLLIVRYVGAHNLEASWTCSECNPYWYNWYCHGCKRVNNYRHWTRRHHYGHSDYTMDNSYVPWTVRQRCACCRSEHRDSFPCEACDDLWELKGTCHTMRNLVKTYNGT